MMRNRGGNSFDYNNDSTTRASDFILLVLEIDGLPAFLLLRMLLKRNKWNMSIRDEGSSFDGSYYKIKSRQDGRAQSIRCDQVALDGSNGGGDKLGDFSGTTNGSSQNCCHWLGIGFTRMDRQIQLFSPRKTAEVMVRNANGDTLHY